jgi:hypothetical protein
MALDFYNSMNEQHRAIKQDRINHKNNTATVTYGDTTVKIKLYDDKVLGIEVRREGKLIQSRLLGPEVDYDD